MSESIMQKLEKLEALIIASRKEVLTIDEVATYTGLSKSYIYKLTSTGGIPCYKPRAKMVYFNKKEIDAWLLRKRIKTKDELKEEAATYVALNKDKKSL